MKPIFLSFLLGFTSIWAQKPEPGEIKITLNADYKPAEITYVDGHKEQGFIYGFISNKAIAVGSLLDTEFDTLESDLNFMDNSFTFKTTLDGEKKHLSQNDIKEVNLYYNTDAPDFYRLMDMKSANSAGEIVDLHKKVWLPLYKTFGKFNIFSYDVYTIHPNTYAGTYVYLNRADDNFAINARDINRMNLFNLDKIDDKFAATLKYIFRDCPEFVQTFNGEPRDVWMHFYEGFLWKETGKKLKQYEKEHKELTKQQLEKHRIDYKRQAEILPYIRCIEEYYQKCPK